MTRLFLALSVVALAATAFPGCHSKSNDPKPTICYPSPVCVAGTIVAVTCMDGPLIEVDPAYRIGAPGRILSGYGAVSVGNNVIALINRDGLGRLDSVGQRIYFTFTSDPSQQPHGVACFAADGLTAPVPHFVLSNVSTTVCGSTTPQ